MKLKSSSIIVAVIAGMIALPSLAFADRSDMKALSEAKLSLVDAIVAAEKHVGGKAFDASIDDDSFSPAFEIDVAKDGKSFDVRVDGKTGEIIGAREDHDRD